MITSRLKPQSIIDCFKYLILAFANILYWSKTNPSVPFNQLPCTVQLGTGSGLLLTAGLRKRVEAVREAIDKNISMMTAHIMQTAALSKSGMLDDASWGEEQLRTIKPAFVATDITKVFPIEAGEQRQNIVDQLRKAGIE